MIPRRREDLPVVDRQASSVGRGRWWGQRELDHDGTTAAYPLGFGFGLGYTAFTLDDLDVGPLDGEHFSAGVSLTTTGTRTGRHVIQVSASAESGPWPVRNLVGFMAVEVPAGQSAHVTVDCTTRPLYRWTGAGFEMPSGGVLVEAASYSGDPRAVTARLDVATGAIPEEAGG